MELNEVEQRAVDLLLSWRKWYNEEMFTPWTVEEANLVHAQFPNAVDRISADSARGTIDNILSDIRAGRLRAGLDDEQ